MRISYELDLNTFEAWSGAVSTLDRIRNEGKTSQLESILDDLYPDGMTDTELNDLLWFDADTVFEWLGLRTESQIQEELDEAKTELLDLNEQADDLLAEYDDECIGIADWEREEIWEDDYKDSYEELQEQIAEINERIAELEKEYAAI